MASYLNVADVQGKILGLQLAFHENLRRQSAASRELGANVARCGLLEEEEEVVGWYI
jgi:hypothetical protein